MQWEWVVKHQLVYEKLLLCYAEVFQLLTYASEWTVWEHQSFLWSCVAKSCKMISQSLELWKDEVQWISLFSPTVVGFEVQIWFEWKFESKKDVIQYL